MSYDIIEGDFGEYEDVKFFTIGLLIKICKDFPDTIVKFFGSSASPGDLGSWRGSYDIPAITPLYEDRTGREIAKELEEALKQTHYGYKGGKYTYTPDDEFYVANHGSAMEYKVVKAQLDGENIILYTKIDPY